MKEGDEKVDKFLAAGLKDINGWKVGSRLWRPGLLPRQLADASRRRQGRHLRERCRRGRVSHDPRRRRQAKRSTAASTTTRSPSPAGQLPPVNAFWSVTMYDGKSQFLIKNPINRYLINSPMLPQMKKNADGSLTLYIQKDSPGRGQGRQLAPRPERHDLPGDAALLAEGDAAFHPAGRRRHVETASRGASSLTARCLVWHCPVPPLNRVGSAVSFFERPCSSERSARSRKQQSPRRGPLKNFLHSTPDARSSGARLTEAVEQGHRRAPRRRVPLKSAPRQYPEPAAATLSTSSLRRSLPPAWERPTPSRAVRKTRRRYLPWGPTATADRSPRPSARL